MPCLYVLLMARVKKLKRFNRDVHPANPTYYGAEDSVLIWLALELPMVLPVEYTGYVWPCIGSPSAVLQM